MSRFHNYINHTAAILREYNGELPLAAHLKLFFATNHKYGSRDRKIISNLAYSYYRTGHLLKDRPYEEAIPAALFLCSRSRDSLLDVVQPDWTEKMDWPVQEKLALLGIQIPATGLFPWRKYCSEGLDKDLFALSFLQQPDLFLRIRPGQEKEALKNLDEEGLPWEKAGADALRLPNRVSADSLLTLGRELIVQDLMSQQTMHLLEQTGIPPEAKVWDCCAGSGGKSLLLKDKFPDAVLTVSDKRRSILINLEKRLHVAGVEVSHVFETDLTRKTLRPPSVYDVLICDAPCSGSGTWARTPEQLYFFRENKIQEYAALQQQILENALPSVKSGGLVLYITCSVFREENEAQAEWLQKKFHLQLIQMELLKGYPQHADSMFAALFRVQ